MPAIDRNEFSEKTKLAVRRGRKATGLVKEEQIAGLPEWGGSVFSFSLGKGGDYEKATDVFTSAVGVAVLFNHRGRGEQCILKA